MQSVSPSQYQCSAMQLPSLQRNSLSEHLRMSRDAMRQESPRLFSCLWWLGAVHIPDSRDRSALLPPSSGRRHQTPGAVSGEPVATPTLDPVLLPERHATHHTARHCCHHSRCLHHSATDSGCSSRSGRGTHPPHTPGGLWAQMNQAAVDREHSACQPLSEAFWGRQQPQCCPQGR